MRESLYDSVRGLRAIIACTASSLRSTQLLHRFTIPKYITPNMKVTTIAAALVGSASATMPLPSPTRAGPTMSPAASSITFYETVRLPHIHTVRNVLSSHSLNSAQ